MFRYVSLVCFAAVVISAAHGSTTLSWRCYDGSLIPVDKRCDGAADCSDGSDERHAVCRNNRCLPNLFRCTYGACVAGGAACNGTPECADRSDELLPKCRNETTVVDGKFTCKSGEQISAAELCDGARDCADGSDERLQACAGVRCAPYLFQCAYGACVNADARCDADRVWHCADGSDEFVDLCNRTTSVTTNKPTPMPSNRPAKCQLPSSPINGALSEKSTWVYHVEEKRTEEYVEVSVQCTPPYQPHGDVRLSCLNGEWNGTVAECRLSCKVYPHPSVTYFCLSNGEERECDDFVPTNTIVRPQCNKNYHHTGLRPMSCINDYWDHIVTCERKFDTTADAIQIDGEGNKVTFIINDSFFVDITGSEYTATTANVSGPLITYRVSNQPKPNEIKRTELTGARKWLYKIRASANHERVSPSVHRKFFVPRVIKV